MRQSTAGRRQRLPGPRAANEALKGSSPRGRAEPAGLLPPPLPAGGGLFLALLRDDRIFVLLLIYLLFPVYTLQRTSRRPPPL